MSSNNEIRGDWKATFIGNVVGWVMRLFAWTYDKSVEDRCGMTSEGYDQPIILMMWHNRIFSGPPLWQKYCGQRTMVALTSASKDGAIIAGAIDVLGVGAARGSSSRRGAAALVTLRRALKAGEDVCITPDGPRGPMCKLQPGAIKLAQASQSPIIMMQVITKDYWELGSWDKLRMPKPFSKVKIILDEPIEVPKDLTNEEFEQLCDSIEGRMNNYN